MVLGARTATLSQDDSLKGGGAPLTEDLPPSQANQRARVSDAETAGLNLYKHLKPAEFLLAH
jgi:hypothetical protein